MMVTQQSYWADYVLAGYQPRFKKQHEHPSQEQWTVLLSTVKHNVMKLLQNLKQDFKAMTVIWHFSVSAF